MRQMSRSVKHLSTMPRQPGRQQYNVKMIGADVDGRDAQPRRSRRNTSHAKQNDVKTIV